MSVKVSIIIPTLNEEDYIAQCLDSILDSEYNDLQIEVFIVDAMSDDRTRAIIQKYQEKYPFIRLFDNPKKIVPIAMNIGISNAKGDYIVRLDAHALYPSNYVSKLLEWSEKLDADNIGTVCVTDVKSNTLISKAIKFVMSDKFGVGGSKFRVGISKVQEVDTVPFGCYKREVFEKNGLFDERLVRVQDLEFNKRLKKNGGKIFLIPDVPCTYFARDNLKDFAKNRFLTGKWVLLASFLTKDNTSVSLRHFVPLAFFSFLFLSQITTLFLGKFIIFPATIFAFYILFLYLRALIKTKNIVFSSFILLAYFILHFSYALGSFSASLSILWRSFGLTRDILK